MSRYVTCRKCGREIDKEWETYDYDEKSHRYTCLSCTMTKTTANSPKPIGDVRRPEKAKANSWELKIVLGGLLFVGSIMTGLNGSFGALLAGGAIGAALVVWGFMTKPDPEDKQSDTSDLKK